MTLYSITSPKRPKCCLRPYWALYQVILIASRARIILNKRSFQNKKVKIFDKNLIIFLYFFSSSPLAESRFILLHFPIESLRAWRQSSRARCSPRCPGWSSTNGKLGNGRHGAKFEFLVTPHAEREGSGRPCLISKTAHTGREPPSKLLFFERKTRENVTWPKRLSKANRKLHEASGASSEVWEQRTTDSCSAPKLFEKRKKESLWNMKFGERVDHSKFGRKYFSEK